MWRKKSQSSFCPWLTAAGADARPPATAGSDAQATRLISHTEMGAAGRQGGREASPRQKRGRQLPPENISLLVITLTAISSLLLHNSFALTPASRSPLACVQSHLPAGVRTRARLPSAPRGTKLLQPTVLGERAPVCTLCLFSPSNGRLVFITK